MRRAFFSQFCLPSFFSPCFIFVGVVEGGSEGMVEGWGGRLKGGVVD